MYKSSRDDVSAEMMAFSERERHQERRRKRRGRRSGEGIILRGGGTRRGGGEGEGGHSGEGTRIAQANDRRRFAAPIVVLMLCSYLGRWLRDGDMGRGRGCSCNLCV